MAHASFIAAGNIAPSRFVKQTTTADHKVSQAGAGEALIGIAQKGSRNTPYSTLDDGFAAIAGEDLLVFQPGDTAPLELGGTVTVGDYLKSDASGKGVTASADGEHYGARALEAGTSGKIVEVFIVIGMRGA